MTTALHLTVCKDIISDFHFFKPSKRQTNHMKYFTIILLFSLLSIGNLMSNSTLEHDYIVDNSEISITVDNKNNSNFFIEINYDESLNIIKYKTTVKVDHIKIVDYKGDLIYNLPLESKDVTIGKSLLENGEYTFLFVNDGNVKRTSTVVIK